MKRAILAGLALAVLIATLTAPSAVAKRKGKGKGKGKGGAPPFYTFTEKSAEFTVTETLKETYAGGGSYDGTATMTFTPSGNTGSVGSLQLKRGASGSFLINGTMTITHNERSVDYAGNVCTDSGTSTLPGFGPSATLEVRARSVRELWLIPRNFVGLSCPQVSSFNPFSAIGSDPYRVFGKRTVTMTSDGTKVETESAGGDTYTNTTEWKAKVTLKSTG
ncbi:MAG: hypothetical protein ACRDH8_12165 [Actinomycetota bacterium]